MLFNANGTPIGSELLYGAASTPQFVYTSETGDDDYWGIGASTEPVNDDHPVLTVDAGIALGFVVTIDGISYDEVLMSSNGSACLASSTDVNSQESFDQCSGTYDYLVGDISDPEYVGGTANYAILSALGNDQYPPDASEPVDGPDGDILPDSCEFGAFLYEHLGDFYCSTMSWGPTTYNGKAAFAMTWYHDPEYDYEDDSDFSTYQVILVNDGAGNATVVYNYDEVNHYGNEIDNDGDAYVIGGACVAEYEGGNEEDYLSIGVSSFTGATLHNTYLDLFGPVCANGVNPQTADALSEGGSYPLSANSLNSAVAGRYAFAIVGGQFTLVLPAAVAAPAPTLAASGDEGLLLGSLAIATLLAGAGLLVYRRRAAV